MFNVNYNPDVLTCLANLSNDEVFTPPNVANEILDLLPKELWSDKTVTFLDPCTKSGIFLREITKRLLVGLESEIPDLQVRIDHILKKQVFGVGITELTALLARRSLYCSKNADQEFSVTDVFSNDNGNILYKNIEHKWKNGKCEYCGVSKNLFIRQDYQENHAYDFIHTKNPKELFNMKFDVIIGNPPYQMSDGGSGYGASAIPIFQKFVDVAKKMNPSYLTMIIPSRWFAGGRGLMKFREEMLNDKKIEKIVDFQSSKECFPGVNIAGGVNYFLWNKNYNGKCEIINTDKGKQVSKKRYLNEYSILIRDNKAYEIIEKVSKFSDLFLNEKVFQSSPFGFRSFVRGKDTPSKSSLEFFSSDGISYLDRNDVKVNINEIDKFKVTIGKIVPSNGEVDVTPDIGYRVITRSRVLKPGQINSESYLMLSTFDKEFQAENFAKYMRLKFPRFLLKQGLSSMNISKNSFCFVPFLDFNNEYDDEKLYDIFNLSQNEKNYIDKIIRDIE